MPETTRPGEPGTLYASLDWAALWKAKARDLRTDGKRIYELFCLKHESETELLAEVERLREALIRCAEVAGEDGEAVAGARSGAMKFPSVEEFALRAVRRLRADYDDRGEPWQGAPTPEACDECGHGWEQHEPWGCRAVVITQVQHGDNLMRCGCKEPRGDGFGI